MVHTIDGTARRRALAEAVWRIVRRDGLAAASVRSVARESELSAGSVRHFFGTQQELVVFAMRELIDTVVARLEAAATIEDPAERATATLAELMPLTDATYDEAAAHMQFIAQARFDPELDAVARETFDGMRGVCLQVAEWLRDAGRLRPDADLHHVAATLQVVIDGLTLQLLFAPHLLGRDAARALLRAHVDGLGA